MEIKFEYLVEDGQVLLEEGELDRLCEETGLDEDEVLALVSEAIKTGESDEDAVKRLKKGMKTGVINKMGRGLSKAGKSIKKVAKDGADKAVDLAGMAGEKIKNHPVKAGLGAAAVIGAGAAGIYGLKKRKQRKQEEEQGEMQESAVIDFLIEGTTAYLNENDFSLLMEAADYSITKDQLFQNILENLEYDIDTVQLSELTADEIIKASEHQRKVNSTSEIGQGISGKEAVKGYKKEERKEKVEGAKNAVKKVAGKAWDKVKSHPKTSVAAGVLGVAGAGYLAHKALKKRKQQKADEEAMKAEDVMIEYLISENSIYLIESDLDFLLEATDFELTEEQIINAICEAEEVKLELPGNGVKVVTSEKELAKIREKQAEDIEDGPEADSEDDAVRTNGGEVKVKVQESVEYDEFAETWEGDHIIMEAVLEDMGIELTESEMLDMIDQHLLSERSIVKLDKQAKLTHAQKKALMVIAREQNDPIYKKLDKLYKQRRVLLNQLEEKYGSRAMSRVRSAKSKAKKVKDED